MPRFAAIEGLRAWLAWAVVLSHISQSLGLEISGGHTVWFERAGGMAVTVFIAVSGFVIAGLVLDRQEPWPRYILRRAFRIFPAYWLSYAGALIALPLGILALPHLTWGQDIAYTYDELLVSWAKAIADHPWRQLALHLTLFQGVVPDSVWPLTSTAALGPAWSLSLEWQFYLLAPIMVWLLMQDRYRMATVLAIAGLALAFHGGLFGDYNLPSFLPGAGYIFLIGIACRIHFDQLKLMPIGPEVIPILVVLAFIVPDALWLIIWGGVLIYLLRAEAWSASAAGRRIAAIMKGMFASSLATYLGARSYSVYMVHFPIIMAMTSLIAPRWRLDQTGFFFALMLAVLPTTLLASELLYRLVERPMIALGARLAGESRPKSVAQAAE